MTLAGKSLFASTLVHGTFVAVLASVVLYPAIKTTDAPAGTDEFEAGWALVMEEPAAFPSESAELSQPPEPEFKPAEITPEVPVIVTNALPIAELVAMVLPTIAAPPSLLEKTAVSTRKKTGAKRGRGSVGTGVASGGSGARFGVYTPAEYASTPRPAYPPAAKSARIAGTVILSVLVDENGNPLSVAKLKSSGNADLDQAAATAVRKWRFRPAKLDGRPVKARLQIPVRFAVN